MIVINKKAKNQQVNLKCKFVSSLCYHIIFVDTAFKQQRLPAWQPIITANTALPVFLIIGLIFIPIGIVLVVTSERVCFLFFFFLKIKFVFLN